MNTSIIIKGASVAAVASLLFTASTFAQVGKTFLATHPKIASSTAMQRAIRVQNRMASSTASTTITAELKTRGDDLINQRIQSLNALSTRIQSMKKLSDSSKTALTTSISSAIADLNNYKTEVDNATSTAGLRGAVSSIANSTRIYALVIPETQIVAAADRVLNVTDSLNTIIAKISSRLASSTISTASSTTEIQTVLSTVNAKIADAITQANKAISEITGLKPDLGNKTIAASNKATLKDARTKIVAAQKDLNDVRQGIGGIIMGLRK